MRVKLKNTLRNFATHVAICAGLYSVPALAEEIDIPVRGIIVATKEAAVSSPLTFPVVEINGRGW